MSVVLSLLLYIFIAYSYGQITVKNFQAAATYTQNGRSIAVEVYYDYNAQKLAQVFTFSDGSSTREVYYYDKGIQFSVCSDLPNSCQSVAWNLGQWIWFVNSSQVGISDNVNGNSALRFDIVQPNGWGSSVWFSVDQNGQGFNQILRATMTKGSNSQVTKIAKRLTLT